MNAVDEPEILLVEDNARDAELTVRALEQGDIANRLVHVKDGEEALDYILGKGPYAGRDTRRQPIVVLLDLKLPKVDGLEVLRALKSDERTKSIPVVVLTSSREESDIVKSYRLGVNSFIVKPVDFDKFSATVAELGRYWGLLNQPPD